MKVYKNTLMHIALAESDLPTLDDMLEGPSAFVFAGADVAAAAKAVKNVREEEPQPGDQGRFDGRRSRFRRPGGGHRLAAVPRRAPGADRRRYFAASHAALPLPSTACRAVWPQVTKAVADQKEAA